MSALPEVSPSNIRASLRKIRGGCVPGLNVDLHLSCGFGGCLLKSFDCFALAFHFFGGGLWYLR